MTAVALQLKAAFSDKIEYPGNWDGLFVVFPEIVPVAGALIRIKTGREL